MVTRHSSIVLMDKMLQMHSSARTLAVVPEGHPLPVEVFSCL